MSWLLSGAVLGLSALGAGWSVLAAALDRRPPNPLLVVLLVLEVLLLAQLVVAVVAAVRGDGSAVFVQYAVLLPFLLPAGVFWSSAEQSRASTLVLTVACVSVAIMTVRMQTLYGAA